MPNEPENQWERELHAELRQLPELPAPRTLVPDVLAAIRAREQQPWWQQPWMTWPRPAQFGSAAGAFALLGVLGYFIRHAGDRVDSLTQRASSLWASLEPGLDTFNTLANAFGRLTGNSGQQFLLYASIMAVVMYLSCVGIGTMLYRTLFQKR